MNLPMINWDGQQCVEVPLECLTKVASGKLINDLPIESFDRWFRFIPYLIEYKELSQLFYKSGGNTWVPIWAVAKGSKIFRILLIDHKCRECKSLFLAGNPFVADLYPFVPTEKIRSIFSDAEKYVVETCPLCQAQLYRYRPIWSCPLILN